MTMNLASYFKSHSSSSQKAYEALRSIFKDGLTTRQAALKANLSYGYLKNLRSESEALLKEGKDPFFSKINKSEEKSSISDSIIQHVIDFRKKNLSIVDIKTKLEALDINRSLDFINKVLKSEGFEPLPRRTRQERAEGVLPGKIQSPRSSLIQMADERFTTLKGALPLVFLPLMEELGIIKAIEVAEFPGTSEISSTSYILSFLALKLIGSIRLSHDETWNLDRGLGLFAGLNVLPKSASLSSYSYRVTRESNKKFMQALASIFIESDFESGEFNLDFHAIPHWGDLSVLEKHWNGSRGRVMKSALSLIVHDPNSSFLSYTDAELQREDQNNAILDFVDFWKDARGESPKMLIFDSKLTDYENLNKLNGDTPKIKFITRRFKNEVQQREMKGK